MNEQPWWVKACMLCIATCAFILIFLLAAYWWLGKDNPSLPVSTSTAGIMLTVFGAFMTIVAVTRAPRTFDGRLLEFVAQLMRRL